MGTLGARVSDEKEKRFKKTVKSNGKNVNRVLNELTDGYLDGKLKSAEDVSDSTEPLDDTSRGKTETETFEIVNEEEEEVKDEDFPPELPLKVLKEGATERGYTMVETPTYDKLIETLRKAKSLLDFVPKGKSIEETEIYSCPECDFTANMEYDKCPNCGQKFEEWRTE